MENEGHICQFVGDFEKDLSSLSQDDSILTSQNELMEVDMEKQRLCVICGNVIDSTIAHSERPELFAQVDALGVDSLTEDEQALYDEYLCYDCFEIRCFEF